MSSQTNQSDQKAINHRNLTSVGFVMALFASIKRVGAGAEKARQSNTSTRTCNSNLCSTARNFTAVKSLIWWIHLGDINIPYLGPVKTVDRINVFSLKLRDVLLTLSHSHLNQRIDLAIFMTGTIAWTPSATPLLSDDCISGKRNRNQKKKKKEVMNGHDLVRELAKESSFSAGNDLLLAFLQEGFFFFVFF